MTEWLPLKRFVDPSRPITYGIVQAGADVPGGVPYIRPVDMDEHHGVRDPSELRTTSPEIAASYRRSTIRQGDLVVSIGPSFGKTMIVDDPALDGANLTQGTARVSPRPGVDARFLQWTLQSMAAVAHWEASVGGATFRALNLGPLAETPIPFVGLPAQRAIADFLDSETARIDALITKKRRMVALLDEWEQACGLAILGDFRNGPTKTLRQYRASVLTGPFGTVLSASEYVEGGVPLVNPTHIRRGRIEPESGVSVPEDVADRIERHKLLADDIVMGRKGDVGRCAIVPLSAEGWICGSDSIGIRCDTDHLHPEYVGAILQLDLYRQQLQRTSTGAMVANVNEGTLLGLRLLDLRLTEQAKAVATWSEVTRRRDCLVDRLSRQITLLQEHRQALLTAAVTGELEVPGVAA